MILARVLGTAVSVIKHPAYEQRKLLVVQPLSLNLTPRGKAILAVDYVGAGPGDLVIVGAGPGVAREVFRLDRAPIRELVMAIVDSVDVRPLPQSDPSADHGKTGGRIRGANLSEKTGTEVKK